MLAYIKGKINNLNQSNSSLILENNNIGFFIKTNLKTLCGLERGQETIIYINSVFREDGLHLYGFLEQAEKELFEKLTSVSGIGPKAALSILNLLDVKQFITAVIKEDINLISSAPGIGKKTAQRLILELKTTLSKNPMIINDKSSGLDQNHDEVFGLLLNLGFDTSDIIKKLENAKSENIPDDLESLVKFCLKS